VRHTIIDIRNHRLGVARQYVNINVWTNALVSIGGEIVNSNITLSKKLLFFI